MKHMKSKKCALVARPGARLAEHGLPQVAAGQVCAQQQRARQRLAAEVAALQLALAQVQQLVRHGIGLWQPTCQRVF